VFGLALDGLIALHRQHQAQALRLPSGLGIWIKGHMNASDGADFNHAVALSAPAVASATEPAETTAATETPARLVDHSQRLIETTLASCDGNIAKAARALGVSRGMLYRRLQKSQQRDTEGAEASRPAPPG
jgi:DNA-binding NtrC family response regulator